MSAYVIKPDRLFPGTWDVKEISDDDVLGARSLDGLVVSGGRSLEYLFWSLAGFILENLPGRIVENLPGREVEG